VGCQVKASANNKRQDDEIFLVATEQLSPIHDFGCWLQYVYANPNCKASYPPRFIVVGKVRLL